MTNYQRINISSDGNCLFRCIATFIHQDLINCSRYKNGKPKSKILANKESITADNLRKFVVFRLGDPNEAEKFNNWQDYDSEEYDDIYDRIKDMKKNTTWGGILELKQLSTMLNLKFNIYVLKSNFYKFNHKDIDKIYSNTSDTSSISSSFDNSDDISNYSDDEETIDYSLNIISTIGNNFENECNLILEENHYELLIFQKETNNDINVKEVEVVVPINIGFAGLGTCLPHKYNLRSQKK